MTPKNPIEIPFLTACRRRFAIAGTTERRHPNTPLLVIEKGPASKGVGANSFVNNYLKKGDLWLFVFAIILMIKLLLL